MSKFKVGDIVEFCGKSYILVNKISYILNLWHALSINDVIYKKTKQVLNLLKEDSIKLKNNKNLTETEYHKKMIYISKILYDSEDERRDKQNQKIIKHIPFGVLIILLNKNTHEDIFDSLKMNYKIDIYNG